MLLHHKIGMCSKIKNTYDMQRHTNTLQLFRIGHKVVIVINCPALVVTRAKYCHQYKTVSHNDVTFLSVIHAPLVGRCSGKHSW
jgi:hypothetical protein